MKTRKHRPTRNSAIHRLTRNAAVSERRRRLSLWQFYQTRPDEISQQTAAIEPTTEASAR